MTIFLIITGVVLGFIILKSLFSPQKMMLRKIDSEARKIVNDVLSYVSSECNDENKLFSTTCKLLNIDENLQNQELIDGIKKYCISIEGICYFIALNFRLPISMKLRCAQFVNQIDHYLYQNGVKPCSQENKGKLLKYCDLYDIYIQSPSLFYEYSNISKNNIHNNKEIKNNEEVFIEKAKNLIKEKKYYDAIEIHNKLLENIPDKIPIYLDRGYAFFCLREYNHAIEDYSKVLDKNPNDGNTYYLRAGAYLENKDYFNAIADFSNGLKFLPDNAGALFRRGSAYSNIKEFDKAIEDLSRSIEIDNSNSDVFMCRAWCYAKLNKGKEFKDDLLNASKLNPEIAEGLKRRYNL
jgi:tetratricopeptide (TPR) repeat protein